MERRVTDRGGNVGPEARRFRWIGIARTRGPDPPGDEAILHNPQMWPDEIDSN